MPSSEGRTPRPVQEPRRGEVQDLKPPRERKRPKPIQLSPRPQKQFSRRILCCHVHQ